MGALNRPLDEFEEVDRHEGTIKLDLLGLKQQNYSATVYVNGDGTMGYVVVEDDEAEQVIFCSETPGGLTYTLEGSWEDPATVDDKKLVAVDPSSELEDVLAKHSEHTEDAVGNRDGVISALKRAPQLTRDMSAQVGQSASPSIFSDLRADAKPAFDLGSFKKKAQAFRRLTTELDVEKSEE